MADMPGFVERLVTATNAHDLEALVDCFAEDYVNETPAHPPRGFRGREQVRRNWSAIFAAVPDITVRVLACAVGDEAVWTEWEMSGTRRDGGPHLMRGVIVFVVRDGRAVTARFYLEPVETSSGDVDDAVRGATSARPA
ncbi:nuclear transport factor 2 family protein [Labedaea rhizosphaerae]|uniref:Ketosteroid isomerase-like protein n=1 Tax=Labedaea rhizosphaerae TaxID=598644 RepID=A0A4R6RUN0_LABRH|nr:nuclear transport factor 2 family protein [Labedaea rhizosphaerae]TDP90620.1 ketosteroid isomerase-like protein [Labedaea rhizosphaerae]